jgi:cell division septum initiation protein DivIVA
VVPLTEERQQARPVARDLPPVPGAARPAAARPQQPHLSGDLPTILDGGPSFAAAMRGYDRLQVDNYVAWAESELRAAQRITTELLDRLSASETELRRARELMARSARDRDLVQLADRVADLLRLAAQEAAVAARVDAADAAQATELVARARDEAEVIVRRARRLEAHAAARLQGAERRLAEARGAEEQTRARIGAMLQEATEERERLEADAAARLTAAWREVHELEHHADRARAVLRQLAGQVEAAVTALGEEEPAQFSFRANRADPRGPAFHA